MTRVWDHRGRERVLQTVIFGVDRHRLISPRTGREHDMFVLDCPEWCNIVPIVESADGDHVVMVRQQRHGVGQETLELPGGMVDPHDASPLEAARRELYEETGYRADGIEPIGVIAPNPAMQTNRCHSFRARGVVRVGAPEPDGGEDIEVVTIPIDEIPERVARGEICHALVVVAFTYAFGLRPPVRPGRAR